MQKTISFNPAFKFSLLLLVSSTLLTACQQPPSSPPSSLSKASIAMNAKSLFKQDSFSFHTRDWFAGIDPLNATVHVKRLSPQVVSAHFTFTDPLDPQKGFNSSMLHYFLFCFGSLHSNSIGRNQWALGSTSDESIPYAKTTKITIAFAGVNDTTEINNLKSLLDDDKPIIWKENFVNINRGYDQLCRDMLKPAYWQSF